MSLSELRFSRDESSENQYNLNYDLLHNDYPILVIGQIFAAFCWGRLATLLLVVVVVVVISFAVDSDRQNWE